MEDKTKLIENQPKVILDPDAGLVIKDQQYIPDEWLDALREEREDNRPFGDGYFRVARIPVAVVDRWYREGFNIYEAPIKDIMERLRAEELTAFLATNKRV